MLSITLVGLGPGSDALLTTGARTALGNKQVFLRSARHPALDAVPGLAERRTERSLDARLGAAPPSDDLQRVLDAFVNELLEHAGREDVVYAVPGHPLVADASARLLMERATEHGIHVHVVPGLGVVDLVAGMAAPSGGTRRGHPRERVRSGGPLWPPGLGPGLQVVDMLDLALAAGRAPFAGGWAPLSPLRPAILVNPRPASLLERATPLLQRLYPPDARFVAIGSDPDVAAGWWPIGEVARLGELTEGGWTAALFISAVDCEVSGRTSEALQRIVARLRAPAGCPWDREQTHLSLLQSGLEEAYEAFDAIRRGDRADMTEELGDLLLQVFLHAQIAEEAGEFALEDVFDSVTSKLVRRHPHVFGDVVAHTAGDVLTNWDGIKRGERAARGESAHDNLLGKIPAALPALMRAQTVLRRADRAGLLRLNEDRLNDALRNVRADHGTATVGRLVDALLAIALAANHSGVDLEDGLRARTQAVEEEAGRIAVNSTASETTEDHDEDDTATEGDAPA